MNVEDQAGTYFYRFNVEKEPFQNENIRKAFAMAVDQQQMVDFVTKNKEKAAYGFVSNGFKDPAGQISVKQTGTLWKQTHRKQRRCLKRHERRGIRQAPQVTLTYSTSDTHQKIAEALQQMFKENLDVEVGLANMEWNVFLDEQKALKFQLSRSSFLADYADPINFLENFQTGHTMNRTGWSNGEYDKLIQQAKNEADDEAFRLYVWSGKILMDEMPIIPIHFYNHVYLQNEKVSGIVRHPVGYMELKWADKQ